MTKRYETYSTEVEYCRRSGTECGPKYTRDSEVKLVSAGGARAAKAPAGGAGALRAAGRAAAEAAESGTEGGSGDATSTDSLFESARESGRYASGMSRRLRAKALKAARAGAGSASGALANPAQGAPAADRAAAAGRGVPARKGGAVSGAIAGAPGNAAPAAGAEAPARAGGGAVSSMLSRSPRQAAPAAAADARMQAAKHYAASRASVAAGGEAAGAAAKGGGGTLAAPAAEGAGGAVGCAAGAAAALALALVLGICAMLMMAGGGDEDDVGALTGNEAAIARYLLGKDMDALHVAAVMGNVSQESGFDPSAVESSGEGIGICQWSFGRKAAYYDYAEGSGRRWDDLDCQLDWFWIEYTGGRLSDAQRSSFESMDDLDQATVYFGRVFEAPSEQHANWERRKSEAARVYAAMVRGGSGGFGEEYGSASARQRAVADSARTTPWPGEGLCATYVTDVFRRAGESEPYGDARDMARAPWCSSSDRSELKVGMVIAVESSPYGSGVVFGHVGVYVGDNAVMHSESGGVMTTDLDEWMERYTRLSPARWGWANGVDLS